MPPLLEKKWCILKQYKQKKYRLVVQKPCSGTKTHTNSTTTNDITVNVKFMLSNKLGCTLLNTFKCKQEMWVFLSSFFEDLQKKKKKIKGI